MAADPASQANPAKDEWLCGFAAALAAVIRLHDLPTVAKSIMQGDGVTVDQLRKAGVEPFDLAPIVRAMT